MTIKGMNIIFLLLFRVIIIEIRLFIFYDCCLVIWFSVSKDFLYVFLSLSLLFWKK